MPFGSGFLRIADVRMPRCQGLLRPYAVAGVLAQQMKKGVFKWGS